jgi:hypothetical protein
MLLYKKDY